MNLKYPILIFLLMMLTGVTLANSSKPVAIMYERNPWLMVIGSDSPIFVAYDSGQVIWWKPSESADKTVKGRKKGTYYTTQLTDEGYKELLDKLKTVGMLDEYYELAKVTDQPTIELYFKGEKSGQSIAVYGSLEDKKVLENAPKGFVTIYEYMAKFKRDEAKEWTPEFIEVMVWSYEHAEDASVTWPEGWPDIKSKTTRKRGESSYSLYLPYAKQQALDDFRKTITEKGAVEMNGKKWSIATRIPFPYEYTKVVEKDKEKEEVKEKKE
ncbi:MAG: hypothetical protein KAH22_11075 [Thiotrichaceae bacterium]|nr:hypothetical protein [Thiotrichaceae bacterium]